jgi:hypothetical protein
VVLANTLGELFVLQSNAAPPSRPALGCAPLPSSVVWQHGARRWLDAMADDNKYHLHRIHASLAYLQPATLGGALSLLLSRFARREYEAAGNQVIFFLL